MKQAGSPESSPPRLLWPFKQLYYGWGIAATTLLISFASAPMYGAVLSIWVKPIGDDMGWSRTEIAFAFTVGSFLGSMLTSAMGPILDRHGARTVTVVAGVIIASMLVGLALMQAPWQMWIFFGAGRGAAIAGIQFGSTVALANWFVHKRGRASAYAGFGLRFGQAVMPLMVLPIILTLGWRSAYGALAVSTLLLAAVPAFLFMRRRPEDYGLHPDGAEAAPQQAPGGTLSARDAVEQAQWTVRQAFRTPALWMVVVVLSAYGFAQTAVNLHAVASFQERGVSFAASTTIVFIWAMTSAVSTFFWGWLIDRTHIRFTMMATGLFYLVSMVLIIQADSYLDAVVFSLFWGIGAGGWSLGFRLLIPNYFGRRSTGAIRGATAPFLAIVGPVGPTLAGYIRDTTGDYELAFMVFAGVFVIGIVSMLLAPPPRHPSAR